MRALVTTLMLWSRNFDPEVKNEGSGHDTEVTESRKLVFTRIIHHVRSLRQAWQPFSIISKLDDTAIVFYQFYAKDINGTLTTVETRDPLMMRVIGQRQELSFYDVKLANKAYCDGNIVISNLQKTTYCICDDDDDTVSWWWWLCDDDDDDDDNHDDDDDDDDDDDHDDDDDDDDDDHGDDDDDVTMMMMMNVDCWYQWSSGRVFLLSDSTDKILVYVMP